MESSQFQKKKKYSWMVNSKSRGNSAFFYEKFVKIKYYTYICIINKCTMKNIICIDLTTFNNEKLVEVAKIYNLKADVLIKNKKDGFAKLFIGTDFGNNVIAYTTKKDKNTILYTDLYTESLMKIESVKIESVKVEKEIEKEIEKEPIEMTVDTILDKISKYGINSLSITEKKFLDENSN